VSAEQSKFIGTWSTWWQSAGGAGAGTMTIAFDREVEVPDAKVAFIEVPGFKLGLLSGLIKFADGSTDQTTTGSVSTATNDATPPVSIEIYMGNWSTEGLSGTGTFVLICSDDSPNVFAGYYTYSLGGDPYPWGGARTS
jgi:hypothetical protein